jgi:alpha-mannosidase
MSNRWLQVAHPPAVAFNLNMKRDLLKCAAAAASACLAVSGLGQTAKQDLTKDPTLYLVGYAHLDTQWLWMYPVVIREYLRRTMEDNFKLFDEYPHYTFTFTGSNRYRLMKEYWPDDYAKLKKYVAEGRWFPGGSSVEEGDVNSPSLESIIRHVMYGNRYFKKEFGVESNEYMLPDCFGFPASLPSILAHCGLKGFSTQKLTWNSAVGIPFNVGRWIGPDGKGVVAALNPLPYDSQVTDDLSNDPKWISRLQADGKKSGVVADYHYFGTGDQGGAPSDESVAWAEKSATGTGPLKVIEGNSEQMFSDLTREDISKLPVYQGDLELVQHSAGSLTSESEMKRWNHQNEKLADAAEKADTAAMVLGLADYPSEKLNTAWNWTLTGQFHDMMAGTARPLAYTYEWNDESLAMNYFSAALTGGVGAVTRALDTRGPGVALVVYNPLSFKRTDAVEATVTLNGSQLGVVVTGPDGKPTPSQVLTSDNGVVHFVFLATCPSVGFATYHVRSAVYQKVTHVSSQMIENDRLRVTVDSNGNVSSIFDKANGRETLSAPIRLAFQAEAPQDNPAWNMDWKDQQKQPLGFVDGPAMIRLEENGPVRKSIAVERWSRGSHFIQQVRLVAGSDRVEFLDKIDWKTTGCALKATFPLKASNPNATYNWQVGTIERGNNFERRYEDASQRWFDLTDRSGGFGCSVLTGAKYGSDKPSDDTVRLTLLYTPTPTGEFEEQGYQDWGRHEFLYGLYPHSSDWKSAGTPLEAMRLDQPMNVFQVPSHEGPLGSTFSLVKVGDDDVTVVAVKKAEDSDHIIVRLREQNGNGREWVPVMFASPIISAREVDGQERPIGPITVRNGSLVCSMGPYAVRAFEVELKKPATAVKAVSRAVPLPYNLDVISDRTNRADGNFDGEGRSLAGDQMPETINSEGVDFQMGPKGEGRQNAVACEGQRIALPEGDWQQVYVLAASSKGDREASFDVISGSESAKEAGENRYAPIIQDWGGYIGEWDTRVWKRPQQEVIYNWGGNAYEGLMPGYMKMQPVAWCCDHKHDPSGDEIYSYSYLFKYSFPIAKGAKTLTLPNDPAIKVMAVSVARDADDQVFPVDPLYDTLPRSEGDAVITPSTGTFNDSVQVSIQPQLFGSPSEIRYSLDGGEPKTEYRGPFWVSTKTTIRARIGDGPVTEATLDVNDTTAPKLTGCDYWPTLNLAELHFSKPLDPRTAEVARNYWVGSATTQSAKLSADGEEVVLQLAGTQAAGPVTVSALARDASPNHNGGSIETQVKPGLAVFSLDRFTCDGHELAQQPAGLPLAGNAPWTMNFFVRTSKPIKDHALIAGFGRREAAVDGASRYLGMFDDGGLRFWGHNVDITTDAMVDLDRWQMLTATFDGSILKVYKEGKLLVAQRATLSTAPDEVHIAPLDGWGMNRRFDSGEIANFTIWDSCLNQEAVDALYKERPAS